MSHNKNYNYNRMYVSADPKNEQTDVVTENEIDDVTVEESAVDNVPEVTEEPTVIEEPAITEEPKFAIGVIANCNALNIREQPDRKATVLGVLKCGTEVQVDIENTLDEWFHVYTVTGLDGFCMKQYIDVKE